MNALQRYQKLLVPLMFVGMLVVLILPMPPIIMDFMIAGNIALAALILLTVIFIEKPLEFSGFPSMLLVTTMCRLVLNVATTRLILSADSSSPAAAKQVAGKVIEQFAMFVAGSSVVVGTIIFVILVVVQFVVITKGATRISEVAARFTLDGMPGKQMAIDADLNAGLINEDQARSRREAITSEADFYGAMDGAAKFVRGDAVAGIIITLINIAGGFAIGMAVNGWGFVESLEVFTMLTIGDGLVSQIPAFLIALASALIVTRSGADRKDLGTELTTQLTSKSNALGLTGGLLSGLAVVTPLPTLPLLSLGLALAGMAYYTRATQPETAEEGAASGPGAAGSSGKKTLGAGGIPGGPGAAQAEDDTPEAALKVDTLELEIGYGLVRLVDTTQGGTLLERISAMRRELAREIGMVLPPIRIRDNMQNKPNTYNIKIRGNTVASGSVHPGHFLAMDSGLATEPLEGLKTREPAFGLEATWVEAGQRERAEALSYTVVDATDVLATHITETAKSLAHELLTRQEVINLVEQLKQSAPKLVEEVLGKEQPLIRTGELQKVLQNLLKERVPVRDLETVLEVLGDWAPRTKDLEVLTEYVRNGLRRTICNQYTTQAPSGDSLDDESLVTKLFCVSLDPQLEDMINGYIERSAEGTAMRMPPQIANRITHAMATEMQALVRAGHHPVVLASPQVRGQVRQLIETQQANVAVLGYNEIDPQVVVESLGLVSLPSGQDAPSQEPAQESVFAGAG